MDADTRQPAVPPAPPEQFACDLQAWAAANVDDVLALIGRLECTTERLKHLGFLVRERGYRLTVALVAQVGAVPAIEALQAKAEAGELSPALLAEAIALVHAYCSGMRVTEYLDAESAASWLAQHRRENE